MNIVELFSRIFGAGVSDEKPSWAPAPDSDTGRKVKASSFADKADVAAFKKAKAKGMTDQEAFKYGDNGVGFTGIDCTDESVPFVALPYEDWMEEWGSKTKAQRQPVLVTIGNKTVRCFIGDTMPRRKNIKNGCGIDLAPGAQKAFGLKPPFTVQASWQWG